MQVSCFSRAGYLLKCKLSSLGNLIKLEGDWSKIIVPEMNASTLEENNESAVPSIVVTLEKILE